MISIKAIFVFLVVSNLFALIVISYNYYSLRTTETLTRTTQTLPEAIADEPRKFLFDIKYQFENSKLAAKVLAELDEFKPVPNSFFSKATEPESVKYSEPYFGLSDNSAYCQAHREAFAENPDIVFEDDKSFVTDLSGTSLLRSQVIPSLGRDAHPNIGINMSDDQKKKRIFDLKPEVTSFFTSSDMFHYKQIGEQFSCLTQISNHIPGHSALTNLETFNGNAGKFAKRFSGKSECYDGSKFFPKSFVLTDRNMCKEFFKAIDSPEYRKLKKDSNIVYVRKSVQSSGVEPMTDALETELRSTYDEGKLCGTVKKDYVMQAFVQDPLLLNGHKFDVRMYMLVASTNPFILFYHDGFLRVSLNNYDPNSDEKTALLSSVASADGVPSAEAVEEKNDLEGTEMWSFEKLETYLLEKGVVSDSNWLDNYLRPQSKKAMINLMRMTSASLYKKSSLYELFSLDFLMDKDLNLWFLEASSHPALTASTSEKEKFMNKMLKDHFEVVFGLLKSRAKRAVNYVNRMMKESGAVKEDKKGAVEIKNLEQRRKEFAEITKNYFEPEFEPAKSNGFSKILDENYFGVQRYNWIVPKECL